MSVLDNTGLSYFWNKCKSAFAAATHAHKANEVTFDDGQTFQTKLDNGSLKGANGINGKDGVNGMSAEITGATATVDANTGTPSVTVYAGGTEYARSFSFEFKNLKGAKGDKGDTGAAGATPDMSQYYRKYSLNAINVDSTAGDWSVDISDNSHGTVPETWVNVEQRSGDHFFVQTATKTDNSTDGARAGKKVWTRNKYSGKAWSTWTPAWNAHASARGSASSLSLAAGAVTQITLDNWVSRDDTGFSFSGGGIKVPRAGNVLISGNVYVNNNDGSQRGCYVKKGSTEIITQYIAGGGWAGGVSSGVVIIPVVAGDVIYLCARCANATTCHPNSGATVLNVMYV